MGKIYVKMRGKGKVLVSASIDSPEGESIGTIKAELTCLWINYEMTVPFIEGVHSLYLSVQAEDVAEVMEITFLRKEEI